MTKKVLSFTIVALVLITTTAYSQQQTCTTPITNREGTDNARITIQNTATVVLQADNSRCTAVIQNSHGSNAMNCTGDRDDSLSDTQGFLIAAGDALILESSMDAVRNEWRCINESFGSNAEANVLEILR